ncbi:MAG: cobalt ECF transporter T component CbiQ [Lamprobacter sp.]|uniref:cobalt ECF transporter T component CbiQ n=1 Tax=Lamprobacter sp. TaxID=3100796 RepID=UPI002B260195|nr:cobalt ECF transporter T component CbiQ [Lamprobacter sp.]MEA3640619.1 cobalt ECF transporter T component CbiQ [Lamprobacter sp.]
MTDPLGPGQAGSDPLTSGEAKFGWADPARAKSAQGGLARVERMQSKLGLGLLEQAFGERPDRLAVFDPRARVIIAALFATTVVSLQLLSTAGLALCGAILVAWLGGVSVSRLRYLLPLELLMLVLVLTLPFSVPGAPLLQLGPFAASAEGLALALLILLKANAVVLILFGLVGAIGPGPTVHALASLGLSAKLCHLLLLTLRQIELVGAEYRRMRLAMRARAFVPRSDRHSWRALGWLIGMLLVRSLARGQRVADAMRCRGFAGELRLLQRFHWQRSDTLLLFSTLPVLAGLLLVDSSLIQT